MRRGSKGFSLVEVLAAVVLLGVGITAALAALGAIDRSQARMSERARLHELASARLAELVATDALASPTLEGDFADRGEPNVRWQADLAPAGVDGLQVLRVRARRAGVPADDRTVEIATLVYRGARP